MPSLSLDFRDSYLLLRARGRSARRWRRRKVATTRARVAIPRWWRAPSSACPMRPNASICPAQVAEYFNAGLQWTVLYEFGAGGPPAPKKAEQEDPEAAFGLLEPRWGSQSRPTMP